MIKRSEYERLLAKKNQQLLKNIKRRFQRIQKKYGSSRAIEVLKKQHVKMTTRNLSRKELEKQYKQLSYINALKTSTIKGVKSYEKYYKPLEQIFIEEPKMRDRFFEIYGKIIEENAWLQNYKYEIWEHITEQMNNNVSKDDIIKNILDLQIEKETDIDLFDALDLNG